MKRKRSLWPAKKEHEIIDLISDDEEQEPVANYQRTVGDEQTPAKLPRKRKPQVDRRPNDVPTAGRSAVALKRAQVELGS